MPTYAYQAVDPSGARKQGQIEAASPEAARRALRDRRLVPVEIAAKGSPPSRPGGALGDAGPSAAGRRKKRSARLPLRELAVAARQLATLTGNGVRIEQALSTTARQNASLSIAGSLGQVRASIAEGKSLASALNEQGEAYPDYVRACIAAGERSGRLPEVLGHLAGHLETQSATRNRVGLALLYPALLAAVSLLMVTLLLVYVVPDIVRVFTARGADLPFLTRALIALSEFLSRYGLILLAAIAVGLVLVRSWAQRPAVRLALHRWAATSPGVRRFSRQINGARFAGTLATLTQSGAPLLEGLRASSASVSNLHVRQRIDLAAQRVHDGGSLANALEEAGCFTPLMVAITASGESAGRLGPSLQRASEDQQRDLDQMVAALVALVEPLVLLVMGGVVLLLVLAILTPIVNLNNLAG